MKYYRITADEKKLRDIINVAYAKSAYKCEKVEMIIMDEEYSNVAQILKNCSDFTFSSFIDMVETYGDYSEHLPWEGAMKEILKVYKNFIITEEEFALQLFPYLKLTDHTVYNILYGQYDKIKSSSEYRKSPAQSFMTYCYEKTGGYPLKWARYMNQKGYVGIVDDTGQGIIHKNEPFQAVFFNLRDLKVLELIKNKGLANWKPVDDDLLSGLLQFLESVGVYDKKDRGYAVQDVNVKEFYVRLFRFLLIETFPKIEQNIYVRLNRYDDDDVKLRQDKPRSLGEYVNKIKTLENIANANDYYTLGTCLSYLMSFADSLKTGENNWSSISYYCSNYIHYFKQADIHPNFESIIEDKIKELLEISKKKPSRVNESFNIDLDHAYDLFQQEYNNATGQSWSKDKFLNRAHNWQFYGDESGFIAVRPQKSGFYKLVGSAGSNRSKLKGFKEALSKGLPLWGMVSKDIVGLLLKLDFRAPNVLERIMLKKMLSQNVLGDAEIIEYTKDGGVTLRYSDVGVVTKYFVGSPAYWKKLYSLKHLLKN